MELHEREFFIARISTGYYKIKVSPDVVVYVHPLTRDEAFEATEIFQEALMEALDTGVMSRKESYEKMLETGVWSTEEEARIKQLEKDMEQYKVDIYSLYFKSNSREKARADLRLQEQEHSQLLGKKHAYDHVDAEGVANYAKLNWMIEKATKLKDGSPYNFSHFTSHEILQRKDSMQLNEQKIRILAKDAPWTNIWNVSKKTGTLFREETFSLTREQQVLMAWSSIYDSIKDSYEAPPDDVINDDDACDGYLIDQRRKRDKQRGQKAADELMNVHPGAQEVFIPAETSEDAARVHGLNDGGSEMVRKNRLKSLEKGDLNYTEFSDVKMRINSERMAK